LVNGEFGDPALELNFGRPRIIPLQGLVMAYSPTEVSDPHPSVSVTDPQFTTPVMIPEVDNIIAGARANVFTFMNDVSWFATRSKNSGFFPPDNPFSQIGILNASRLGFADKIKAGPKLTADIIFNIKTYVNLLDAQKQGAIDFNSDVFVAAQLEHVTLSYSGLGGSGNDAADLIRFLPSADDIKKKKAEDALAILNFSRRLPHVVFTAEYVPNGEKGHHGIIVGWKNMADASGYTLKRHAVIANEDVEFDVPNTLAKSNKVYADYIDAYITTFYENIDSTSLCMYVDDTTVEHEYYIYTVQAYQYKKSSTSSVIPSDFINLNLTVVQKNNIINRIQEINLPSYSRWVDGNQYQLGNVAPQKYTTDIISPWPVYAEQLLGDASLDWVLAAANTRASIDRKDSRETYRKYSYVNAISTFLMGAKLVQPNDMNAVRKAVTDSISTYGIMQTIESLLQDTGILYYFDARDAIEDTTFDRAGTLNNTNSGIIGIVAAAMDVENATIDLRALASNLATVLSNGKISNYTTTLSGSIPSSKPVEISVTDPELSPSANSAELGVGYIWKSYDTSVDMTTFDGISKLMQVIRIMSDFGPNRIKPPQTTSTGGVVAITGAWAYSMAGSSYTVNQATQPVVLATSQQATAAGKTNIAEMLLRIENLKAK
jgi:hypothetical protein